MIYILNINENDNKTFSNVSLNGKLLFKIKNKNNNIHYNIEKTFKYYNFKINKINAICVNNGPSISYIKIRSILSTIKGFCLILNKPLIIINDFIITINNIKKKIKKYKKIFFIILSYNNKKIFLKNTI
ncbi:MAG: hypothetical protein NHG07_00695 [Candidatus Shikimatogenerans bostrichidophilus]|nr:MAG: hypothetical protein NHG07_00695 [Candidatus Shikimatogenerans bostrichidophilus]